MTMLPSALLALPFSIPTTFGSLMVGFASSSAIWGMLCLQTWTYYARYPNDRIGYKLLVGILWVLETIHECFVGHTAWYYCIANFGQFTPFLEAPVWSLSIQVVFGSVVGTIVKICFGMRVFKFSKGNYFITGIIIVMALAQLGLAIKFTAQSVNVTLAEAIKLKTIASAALALGAATDVITALALSYFLLKMRTGYAASDTLIKRLIIYSVNTGAFTSLFSITVVIAYNIMPFNFIFMACYFVLSKLYANSCLATLNTRRFIRGRGTDHQTETGPSFLMVGRSRSGGVEEFKNNKHYVPTRTLEVGVRHEISVAADDLFHKMHTKPIEPVSAISSPDTPSSLPPVYATAW